MSLIFRLARRNLFQDRLRFVATIIGIVFSIVLVTIQLGLFLGFEKHGDDDDRPCTGRSLDRLARHEMLRRSVHAGQARHVEGARRSGCGVGCPASHRLHRMVGARRRLDAGVHRRHEALTACSLGMSSRETRPIFRMHAPSLSTKPISTAWACTRSATSTTIRNHKIVVKAITTGIRSFTTTPYRLHAARSARRPISVRRAKKISYLLVHVSKNADIATVRCGVGEKARQGRSADDRRNFAIAAAISGCSARAQASHSSAGALLGAIVGTVIIAQTLYSSTKDHLTEFATCARSVRRASTSTK